MHKIRFLGTLLPESAKKRIVLLTGARQTGKTTLAKLTYPGLRYINLDAPENREAVRSISSSLWTRDVGNAVIDEAQKEPIVFDKIKYTYDDSENFFEVLLGSSQILLLKKIRESLAGRAAIYELWPLLMSELCNNTKNEDIRYPLIDSILKNPSTTGRILENTRGVLPDKENSIKKDAENYILKWGGMPALLPLPDDERRKWLRDYEYTYLERDLSDLARLDDLMPFRKFQKLSALRSGNLLNYSELARDASVSVDTARRYLEYLNLSYQVILLQPYFKNLTSSVVKTPKLYWLDVGILRQLSGFTGTLSGHIFETMVVAELIKLIKTMQRNVDTYFYRTRSGLELDIILQTGEGIIGMEIKSREAVYKSDTKSMKKIAAGLGSEWNAGLLIYRGNTIRKIAEPNIWAVPSHRLFT